MLSIEYSFFPCRSWFENVSYSPGCHGNTTVDLRATRTYIEPTPDLTVPIPDIKTYWPDTTLLKMVTIFGQKHISK